ncbi:nuclear transport factor 2 family protein [Arthrobacter sp. MYb213]|uniref:nuclear transport factor 2 family protein n=1 Tax=Arthrobacter sp. MYb213 TaxID=1848595 RepID=UPI000CFB26B5|nr:nuclear transport factor 2 family protein [Arthrobacter sp. MYb213]PRB66728.1 hypothetical protein CQ011_17535 [Arthrobacter sp. MYb213]
MAFSPAETRHAIENLLGRYAECADARDARGVAELLGKARVSFAGTVLDTDEQIFGYYQSLFAAAPVSRHLLSNIIVDPDIDGGSARCRYSRWAIESDARLLAMGEYRASFRVEDDTWEFTAFEVSRAWQA